MWKKMYSETYHQLHNFEIKMSNTEFIEKMTHYSKECNKQKSDMISIDDKYISFNKKPNFKYEIIKINKPEVVDFKYDIKKKIIDYFTSMGDTEFYKKYDLKYFDHKLYFTDGYQNIFFENRLWIGDHNRR